MIAAIRGYLEENAGALTAAFSMDEAKPYLLPGTQLPQGSMVILAAVPYFCGHTAGEISKYARGRDYHRVLRSLFAGAISSTGAEKQFSASYTDVSPFDEVRLAAAAGLGKIGENGLLLTEPYGSYVFLGEICGDFSGEAALLREPSYCDRCGACRRACPTQGSGCLSEITQRRGELTVEEESLMRRYKTAWGCDICQDVCPANQNVEKTKLPAFSEELVYRFDADELSGLSGRAIERKYADRAFIWRGGNVVKRNAAILCESDADNARS